MQEKYLFTSGLHRSGTTILHSVLKNQADISGFNNNGVYFDEGQHLQTVYNNDNFYGGAGTFAFFKQARLTETHPLITEQNKEKLIKQWNVYWDRSKSIFIEKSPPNLIKTRFLQALFPESYFITIIRNPIAVSYATQKWSETSIDNLIEHWLHAYKIYEEDKKYLKNEFFFSYEEMVAYPQNILSDISKFIRHQIFYNNAFQNENKKYFKDWNSRNPDYFKLIYKYEEQVNEFGYSLIDLERHPPKSKLIV